MKKRRWRLHVGVLWIFVLGTPCWAGEKAPTFTKDVAPILFRRCVKCHAAGQIAFRAPLTSYEAVRARAELIKQKVMKREMPPWPVDAEKSVKLRNDPRLSRQEIDTIVAWVNAGAAKGSEGDLPALPKSVDGWTHPSGRAPDLVISLPGEMHLPATGDLHYARVLVKVPFTGERWIVASQTRPSNPAVVHHLALTEVTLPDGMTPAEVDRIEALTREMGIPNNAVSTNPAVSTPVEPKQPDMLGIYVPGSGLELYEDGSAKLLKGGPNLYLNFNTHYETTGKPETDRSSVVFWFRADPPEHQLFRVNGAGETVIANGTELLSDAPGVKAEGTHVAIPPIPAFAENYELIGITGYAEPVTIYQFQPHAHNRGKDFTYTAVYPDGREQIMLSVSQFDHRWQMAYEPETPIELPAGSKLVVTAHYDNSAKKMHNHAPEKEVYFQDQNQSWDEMFTPFVQYSVDGAAGLLETGEAVGCLEGDGKNWILTHASEPVISATQATTSAELKKAASRPLGNARYKLLGLGVFRPANHREEKVAVKGILIRDGDKIRVNVTSLQEIGAKCAP